MTKTFTAALLTALALLLSACGGSGSGSGSGPSAAQKHDATASRSLAKQILKTQKDPSSPTSGFFALKRKDATCIGTGLVRKVGTKSLQRYGVLDKSYHAKRSVNGLKLKPADATKTTSVFFSCTDVTGGVKAAVAKSAASLPKKTKTCINQQLTDANLKPVFEKYFEGDATAAQNQLREPLSQCALGSQGGQ